MRKTYFIISIILLFFLAGCDRLKKFDQKIGEVFFDETNISTTSEWLSPPRADELSQEDKDRIDAWFKANGFNRYGDPEGTRYASGTPLFHHNTGKPIGRYEYILYKHPDIMGKIN